MNLVLNLYNIFGAVNRHDLRPYVVELANLMRATTLDNTTETFPSPFFNFCAILLSVSHLNITKASPLPTPYSTLTLFWSKNQHTSLVILNNIG